MKILKTNSVKLLSPSFKSGGSTLLVFILCCALSLIAGPDSQAIPKLTADVILKKVEQAQAVQSETTELQMTIQERDGSKKERSLVIKKKAGDVQKALIKIKGPNDLKGVGLLTVSEASGEESQWLFLPSQKRPRRIQSSNKNGRFLDSDLSYEDLSISTYRNFNNKLVKVSEVNGRKVAIIQSDAKSKKDSSYGNIKTWVDLGNYQVLKANYYNHRKKLVKKMLFQNHKKYDGKVWRARKVIVQNIPKRRSTVLEVQEVSLKQIGDGDLSMSALEEI